MIDVKEMKMCFSIRDGHNLMNEMEIIDNVDKIRDLARNGSIYLMATRGRIHLYTVNTDILAVSYPYDIHYVLDELFYNMKDLLNGIPVRVSLPAISFEICTTSDKKMLEVRNFKKKVIENDAQVQIYKFPKEHFLSELIEIYWRKTRIFQLIGEVFPILGEGDDPEDQVTVLNHKELVLNWRKYTPIEILDDEQIERLKHLMEIPIRELILEKACS